MNLFAVDDQSNPKERPITPTLDEVWSDFTKWKNWTDKLGKANSTGNG
jgi:hypothetical protein